MGYGIGPLFLAPITEIPQIGRNLPYIVPLAIFCILQIPTALVDNFAGFCILRFIAGFVSSPPLATGGESLPPPLPLPPLLFLYPHFHFFFFSFFTFTNSSYPLERRPSRLLFPAPSQLSLLINSIQDIHRSLLPNPIVARDSLLRSECSD